MEREALDLDRPLRRARGALEERHGAQDRAVALPRPRAVRRAPVEDEVGIDDADAARVHVAARRLADEREGRAPEQPRIGEHRVDAVLAVRALLAVVEHAHDVGARAARSARARRGSPRRRPSCRPRRGRSRACPRAAARGPPRAARCRDGRPGRPRRRARPRARRARCRGARPPRPAAHGSAPRRDRRAPPPRRSRSGRRRARARAARVPRGRTSTDQLQQAVGVALGAVGACELDGPGDPTRPRLLPARVLPAAQRDLGRSTPRASRDRRGRRRSAPDRGCATAVGDGSTPLSRRASHLVDRAAREHRAGARGDARAQLRRAATTRPRRRPAAACRPSHSRSLLAAPGWRPLRRARARARRAGGRWRAASPAARGSRLASSARARGAAALVVEPLPALPLGARDRRRQRQVGQRGAQVEAGAADDERQSRRARRSRRWRRARAACARRPSSTRVSGR